MRIVYLGNNKVGWQILDWLKQQGEEIVGLVIHPPHKQKYTREMREAAGLPDERIFDGSRLREPETLVAIEELNPDIALSLLFGYILKPSFLTLFTHGCINLHPAYLPYNRGAYPNVWSIVEGTPAGVTLHYIDEGVDTGDIIAQRAVPVEPVDTGETLYHKLEQASIVLFQEMWPCIKDGTVPRATQISSDGTYHRMNDVEQIDCIDLEKHYTARELINILRARTFHPHSGAYFFENERKIGVRVQLEYIDE